MSQIDPLMSRFIDQHAPSCPLCRHALVGMSTTRCPHCREDLVLDVAMSDPSTRHIALGAIGLGIGFGFFVSMTGIMFSEISRRSPHSSPFPWLTFLPILLGGPILGLALVFWIRFRRLVRAATPLKKWVAVLACWFLTLGLVAWLLINIILDR